MVIAEKCLSLLIHPAEVGGLQQHAGRRARDQVPSRMLLFSLRVYHRYIIRNILAIRLSVRISLCYRMHFIKGEQGEIYAN
jgi:hypothetical protein